METNIYDVYGFVISIDDLPNAHFFNEYGYFKVNRPIAGKVDLFVKVSDKEEMFPTKPAGSDKGLYLPFGKNENTLWYNRGVHSGFILHYCEALMWWSDKTFLHAGVVSKHDNAYVFMGGGGVGKTSIVLNLIRKGYKYLSDDWSLIGEGKAYPFPKTFHVFDYNLQDKEIAKSVLGLRRFYYSFYFKFLDLCMKLSPHRYVKAALEKIRPRFDVQIQRIVPTAEIGLPSVISEIFYLERQNRKDIVVKQDLEADELARRMVCFNRHERYYLFKEYYKYVHQFNIKNSRIENLLEHDTQIMYDTFRRTKLSRVLIPKEADLTSMNLNFLFHK